jgi:hypothetical protein
VPSLDRGCSASVIVSRWAGNLYQAWGGVKPKLGLASYSKGTVDRASKEPVRLGNRSGGRGSSNLPNWQTGNGLGWSAVHADRAPVHIESQAGDVFFGDVDDGLKDDSDGIAGLEPESRGVGARRNPPALRRLRLAPRRPGLATNWRPADLRRSGPRRWCETGSSRLRRFP